MVSPWWTGYNLLGAKICICQGEQVQCSCGGWLGNSAQYGGHAYVHSSWHIKEYVVTLDACIFCCMNILVLILVSSDEIVANFCASLSIVNIMQAAVIDAEV